MRSKEYFAYLAGVADSDGSFSISRLHRTRPTINYNCQFSLTWINNENTKLALQELVNTYGGSFCMVKPKVEWEGYSNQHPYLKYCLTGQKLRTFIEDIKPYLRLKSAQASNLLQVLSKSGKRYGWGRPRPQTISDEFALLYLRNIEENHKNKQRRKSC